MQVEWTALQAPAPFGKITRHDVRSFRLRHPRGIQREAVLAGAPASRRANISGMFQPGGKRISGRSLCDTPDPKNNASIQNRHQRRQQDQIRDCKWGGGVV